MTPDLSYYWEGGRELCEDNKWDEKKNVAWVLRGLLSPTTRASSIGFITYFVCVFCSFGCF